MKFPVFDMERMQSTWEHRVKYDLSESGVEAMTLEEITRDQKELMRSKLGYAEGVGREQTRALIAGFHSGADAKNVLITTGTSEANFLALLTLVSSGDEVVVVMPNYMQVHGIAQGLGARVREVWLREERGWRIDLDALAAAVNERTKLICVCTPNNPTGQVLSPSEIDRVVAIAAKHGAWILSDEVYRGAELDSVESASFSGRGERVVVTGGLSKVYGLPGLRVGWLVASETEVQNALRLKDYTTIAPATLSESLAEVALERRDELLKRAASSWASAGRSSRTGRRRTRASFTGRPRRPAGSASSAIAFPLESMALVDRLIREYSTMVVPASTSARSGICASATAWSRASSTPGWRRSTAC
jgi:aspartate/methionine/tyrosine aminotransferase